MSISIKKLKLKYTKLKNTFRLISRNNTKKVKGFMLNLVIIFSTIFINIENLTN